ncbi:MAG: pseudouridine synthase [Opitutaceae bacterium]|nr:pseudouridine synthase [Opitutaceae bacterium]
MLSQFTPEPGSRWATLASCGFPKGVYPLGRLDADSEGLLLLTDEAALNARLLSPGQGHVREYWAQVEGVPTSSALARLTAGGLSIGGHRTRPCHARVLAPDEIDLPPRNPPIRVRKSVPDAWIALRLTEGKSRQVRRMTAAVGLPTLRLFRAAIGSLDFRALDLDPGEWRPLQPDEIALIWKSSSWR